ncbi:hypothetical protein EVA_12390 [gut metagenome]|uniref:Uncharacterized protein n=1 Tax=gut metagenome TaxID=749906 RepID=J9GCH9_9ZZZZ
MCEAFPAPEIEFGPVALPLNARYAITHRGPVLRCGGMQGVWYRIEREGREKYVLALPDRCRVQPAQAPQKEPGFEITGSGTDTQLLAAVRDFLNHRLLSV